MLVIGGTRGTGYLIVRLLEREGVPVRVLARDVIAARARLGASLDIVAGDVTRPETLPAAFEQVSHVVFTAGIRSGRPARESRIKATEYDGVRHALAAARDARFSGRFLYMTASGVNSRSFAAIALNIYKGNTLVWRRRAEDEIRASGLDYTIIRAGVLVDAPGGTRAIVVTQRPLGLSFRHRIARSDVAEVFVAAIGHPRTSRTTFDIVWGSGPRTPLAPLLDSLRPDTAMSNLESHDIPSPK